MADDKLRERARDRAAKLLELAKVDYGYCDGYHGGCTHGGVIGHLDLQGSLVAFAESELAAQGGVNDLGCSECWSGFHPLVYNGDLSKCLIRNDVCVQARGKQYARDNHALQAENERLREENEALRKTGKAMMEIKKRDTDALSQAAAAMATTSSK